MHFEVGQRRVVTAAGAAMQLNREASSGARMKRHDLRPPCVDRDLDIVAMQMHNRGPVGMPGDLDCIPAANPDCPLGIREPAVFDAQLESFYFIACVLCSGVGARDDCSHRHPDDGGKFPNAIIVPARADHDQDAGIRAAEREPVHALFQARQNIFRYTMSPISKGVAP